MLCLGVKKALLYVRKRDFFLEERDNYAFKGEAQIA